MKLHYYPETDSLYIELKAAPGTQTREVADGLVVDLDERGEVVGFDIDLSFQAVRPVYARNGGTAAAYDDCELTRAARRMCALIRTIGRDGTPPPSSRAQRKSSFLADARACALLRLRTEARGTDQ
jgi:uncharacterized protein YuzE